MNISCYSKIHFFVGDSEHKSCIISTPDVGSLQLEGDEDFIILACDGLWDCVEYTEAAQLVYEHVVSSPGKKKKYWNYNKLYSYIRQKYDEKKKFYICNYKPNLKDITKKQYANKLMKNT